MGSKTEIFTMATTHIGKPPVGDAVTSNTVEAKKCRVFYDTAVDFVLEDHDWGFASKREALVLADSSEYASDWDYAYIYPNDCAQLREILTTSGVSNTSTDTYNPDNRNISIPEIPFDTGLSEDGTQRLIFTNQKDAIMRYTKKIDDPNLFSAGFTMAVSYYLAYLISYPLTRKRSLKSDMLQEYNMSKFMSKGHDANEMVEMPNSEPDAILARD